MKSLLSLLLMTAVVLALSGSAVAADDAQTQWLKKAQLGPYAPATQDWNAIEAAARQEGKVVLFSVSSRFNKIQKSFKDKYGVELVGHDITSDEQVEKYSREHKAGLFQTDVLFNNATSELHGKMLPDKMIWNFVPDQFARFLDESEKNPFLVQRWSSRVFVYNSALYPSGPPIKNIWTVTRPEWKGKVLTPDPSGAAMANAFQTILNHPNEMASAYEKEFGQPIKLSSGIKNAAEEWLMRFLKNAVISPSTDKIFESVGDVKQKEAPVGITTFSKLRDVKKGVFEATPIFDMEPVFGVGYPTVLVICDRAPHPNAAKLLIRFMMDEEGIAPWNVFGDYPSRSDLEDEHVKKFKVPYYSKAKIWNSDAKHIFDTSYDYLQFVMSIGK
ncbi:MAG: substrate-binding domain-containing protein [Thermodesulfobacteriota bacterium]